MGARPQAPALTEDPEGQQGREDELHIWGPEETPANQGSATCACFAPLYPLGNLMGLAPPCGPIGPPAPSPHLLPGG